MKTLFILLVPDFGNAMTTTLTIKSKHIIEKYGSENDFISSENSTSLVFLPWDDSRYRTFFIFDFLFGTILKNSFSSVKVKQGQMLLKGKWSVGTNFSMFRNVYSIFLIDNKVKFLAGPQKRADSYFPPEERVRLVRLVSNWVLPGEMSGESSVEYSWNKL